MKDNLDKYMIIIHTNYSLLQSWLNLALKYKINFVISLQSIYFSNAFLRLTLMIFFYLTSKFEEQ